MNTNCLLISALDQWTNVIELKERYKHLLPDEVVDRIERSTACSAEESLQQLEDTPSAQEMTQRTSTTKLRLQQLLHNVSSTQG